MRTKLKVPKFATEAEEAKWWDDHRNEVEENLMKAMERGETQHGTAQRLVKEARESKNITIRMAQSDLALARKQAEEKGLPYQTYIKSVLHEALVKRESRKAS
jgi:predicted DNA binding CopG/RHH family protein